MTHMPYHMLCSEAERTRMIAEIQAISSKIAQEQYLERLKNIIHDIKVKTGQDVSNII